MEKQQIKTATENSSSKEPDECLNDNIYIYFNRNCALCICSLEESNELHLHF